MIEEIGAKKHIIINNLDSVALVDFSTGDPIKYTYNDIDQKINNITSGLLKKNFEPDSRVAIIAVNSFNYIVT